MSQKPVIITVDEIKTFIPHRHPLLLIENIHEIEPEKRILASYLLKPNEPVFEGHFPNNPVYPGVYMIEAIAQAGAVLVFETRRKRGIYTQPIGYLSAVQKARFRQAAVPNNLLFFEVELEKERGPFFWLNGKVIVNENVIAEASLSFALGEK